MFVYVCETIQTHKAEQYKQKTLLPSYYIQNFHLPWANKSGFEQPGPGALAVSLAKSVYCY